MQEQVVEVAQVEQPTIIQSENWSPMSDEAYFAMPFLSAHGLMQCLKSYNHYLASRENKKDTTAMSFGRLAHVMALQPELFSKHYKVAPQADRRTKEGKQLHADFVASLGPDDVAVDRDDYQKLIGMREQIDKIPRLPKIAHFLTEIQMVECSAVRVFAHDNEIGDILLKSKPDAIGRGFILDYKTTQDAWVWGFERSARNYRYDLQLRVYQKMHELMTGELLDMVILAQETEPPYEFQFYVIPNETNDQTDQIIAQALNKYKQGLIGNAGYPREVLALNLVR